MGKPNYPCFDIVSNYETYQPETTTTTTTTTTLSPQDIDFFILPDESAPCPTISFDPNNPDLDFYNPDVVFTCFSPFFDPSPCVVTLKKYIKVADIDVDVDTDDICQRFVLRITGVISPTTTTTTTTSAPL